MAARWITPAGRGQWFSFRLLAAQSVSQRTAVSDIALDKTKSGMRKERDERFTSEKQVVDDRDPVAGPQQLRGQQRADVARAAGDDDVSRLVQASPPISRITFQPLTTRAGHLVSSLAMENPCSRHVSRQMSATSPSPTILTRV